MASLLELCEDYFGTRDFYEVLNIPRNANEKQVKKAYHQLSLLVHPDRVEEGIKVISTEKFKVLGRIHSILSDTEKRKVYDLSGQYDEDSPEVVMQNWTDYWRSMFKQITLEDINNYEKEYKGSETELKDLKRAYTNGKGNMDYILENVPFTNCADEPRIHEIIQGFIDKNEVPEYKSFTEEKEHKKERRRRRWEKEAEETKCLKEMLKMEEGDNDLALAIKRRNEQRAIQTDKFLDDMMKKYESLAEEEEKQTPINMRRLRFDKRVKTPKSVKAAKKNKRRT